MTICSEARYMDQVFEEVRLECDRLASSEFYDCVFVGCDFAESVFHHCRFVNCVFQQCDLSLTRVPECVFSAARFENSKVIGVDWTQVDWPKTGLEDRIGFFESVISHSTFIGLSLRGIQIRDCVARDVDFREADISQANFSGTDLSESLFGNTILAGADLSGARNYRIDPGQNILTQAKFSLPEAISLLYSLDIVLTGAESL